MFPIRQTPEEVVAQQALNQQVEQYERKLVEQQRKDKEQRQAEQIKMQIQLKDFENQLVQQQKRDFVFHQREHQHIQQQVRDYQQKLVNGQQGTTTLVAGGIVNGTQQIQQQVRDYERMLVERQQTEVDRRQRTHFHLQQKLREFERILCEQQQMEFQHLIRNQEQLKTIGMNSQLVDNSLVMGGNTGIMGGICGTGVTGMWAEKSKVLEQQTQEEKHLKEKQERLQKFIKEIESELNVRDIEQQKREVTGHLRAQQVQHQVQQAQAQQVWQQCVVEGGKYPTTTVMPTCGGLFAGSKIEQIQMLEQQLHQYKRILREKLRGEQYGAYPTTTTVVGGVVIPSSVITPCAGSMINEQVQQVLTIEWIKELVQKLRDLEFQFTQQSSVAGCWIESKLQQLKNHIEFFSQVDLSQQVYQYQCHQQMLKLRDLLDYEMPVEIRQQVITAVGPQVVTITKQLCNELVQLVEEKIKFFNGVLPTGETCGVTGMPIEKLWRNLRNVEYRLRDIRQGEYEPHWANIYNKIFKLEQVFGGIQGGVTGLWTGMPVSQKMELIQEHIQQLEWLIQETVFVHCQVPFKYQVVKYQQHKQIVKRLCQLIEDIECQIPTIVNIQTPITTIMGTIQTQPINYQTQMVLRQLKGLRSQLRCLLQQQNLIVMHNKIQQLVVNYERQLPREVIENRVHHVQLQQIMQVVKCLEQQLIEQHLQGYQTYQQQGPLSSFNGVGGGFFCVEDVYEQIKQQFVCQKQLQQIIKEFATLLVQQKQHIPVQVRIATQQVLMQQVREFESLLCLCNDVVVDQEQYFGPFSTVAGVQQIPQYYVQQYKTQHQQFQTLFKQLLNVLCQVQQVAVINQQTVVPQYVSHQQHQQLINALIQQVEQIQMQHQQQLVNYQQYPHQFLWAIEQQQKPCYRRLIQHVQQLQQLQQFLQGTDLLQQQQQYILFKQVQQQLHQLNFINQQFQRTKLWKNWGSWTQTFIPQLHQQLQQLRQQHQVVVKLMQQEFQYQPRAVVCGTPYGPVATAIRQQQMIKSISQPIQLESSVEDVLQYEPTTVYGGAMDANNNTYSSWCVVEPETCIGDDLIVKFFTCSEVEQEKIVAELVQRYIECINMPSEINQIFREKFEQLYFENNKLGQLIRLRSNEIVQLRKQFEEIQQTRGVRSFLTTPSSSFKVLPTPTLFRQTTPYQQLMGCGVPTTTPYQTTGFEQYESLPTTVTGTFGEEPYGLYSMPFSYQTEVYPTTLTTSGKPSLKCVEKMLSSLENKLTQLRLEGGEYYPTTTVTGYPTGIESTVYGIKSTTPSFYAGITEPIQPVTVGQSTVVEVNKKQQLPNGAQISQTQTFQECRICPVCGDAGEKELSQPEFELHVNSHFPYSE